MSPSSITHEDTLRTILANACEARELLILVTPYVRFESNFIQLDKDALHVRITMGAEEAMFALRAAELHIRFPSSTRFMEGRTKLLGLGLVEGRRTIRLAVPKSLQDDEHRGAYRVQRVGRVAVTLSTGRFDLRTGNLINVSTTGAKIMALQDVTGSEFEPGSMLTVSIPLTDQIQINAQARIAWAEGRALGLAFESSLPESVMTPLGRWIFQKREDERESMGGRSLAKPKEASTANQESVGVALISASAELEEAIKAGWGDLPALKRFAPVGQALKEALAATPDLVLVHVAGSSLDERRRLKMVVEVVGNRAPFVLLGTGVENSLLFELGNDLKATSVFGISGKPTPFFFRFIQGVLRKLGEGGEGIQASPKEGL